MMSSRRPCPRRTTPASRPSSSSGASSALPRWAGTSRLNRSRSANSSGNLDIRMILLVGGGTGFRGTVAVRQRRLVRVDVVPGRLVQVAQQDLLIAQREVRDDPGADLRLVASRVLASWNAYSLNVTAASSCESRCGCSSAARSRVGLEDVLVHSGRPVVVGRYQPGAQNSSVKLGKNSKESVPQVGGAG